MKLTSSIISETCYGEVKNIWLNSPDSFPTFLTKIPSEEKKENELFLENSLSDFQSLMKSFPANRKGRNKWKQAMLAGMDHVLKEENVIGVHRAMDARALGLFREDINVCLRKVREFAPELPMEGIGQAIRNYTVYSMLSELYGIQSAFHPAIFGYSMLYPFTDNYIDSISVSAEDKAEYNQIIRDKIAGRTVHPNTPHQIKTCELLSMIESRYGRKDDLTVYLLLELMLDAQQGSMRQQNRDILLTHEERLDISLYKGGLSVLLDRYFVDREITTDDLRFYLAFGFFLQLADDLQDIKADGDGNNQTLFTIDPAYESHERLVNKLLNFMRHIFTLYRLENGEFKNFILKNCYYLVFSSVAGSREFFTNTYVERISDYLPVSPVFLEKTRGYPIIKKDTRLKDTSMKMLDELIS